jgi:hypothetical protein
MEVRARAEGAPRARAAAAPAARRPTPPRAAPLQAPGSDASRDYHDAQPELPAEAGPSAAPGAADSGAAAAPPAQPPPPGSAGEPAAAPAQPPPAPAVPGLPLAAKAPPKPRRRLKVYPRFALATLPHSAPDGLARALAHLVPAWADDLSGLAAAAEAAALGTEPPRAAPGEAWWAHLGRLLD